MNGTKMSIKSHEEVWKVCLSVIKDNVNLQSYKTWFEPIKPLRIKDSILTIQVPSQFFYEWLEEHYITLLKKVIKKELGSEGKLEYSIVMDNNYGSSSPYTINIPTSNRKETKNPSVSMPLNIGGNNTIRNPFIIPGLKKVVVDSQLNPNYSFDTFIEGDANPNEYGEVPTNIIVKKGNGIDYNNY